MSLEPIVCCVASGEVVAFRMDNVEAVLRSDQLDRTDGRPMASLGGASLSIEGLAEELGVGLPASYETVIVTRTPTGRRAIAVERLIGRTRVPSDAMVALPGSIGAGVRFRFDALVSDAAFTGLAFRQSAGQTASATIGATTGATAQAPPSERRSASRPTHAAGRLVTFSVSDDPSAPRVGIAAVQVAELRDAAGVVHLPGAPAHVAGVVAWRGHAVPVLNVGAAMRWLSGQPRHQRLLIARVAGLSGLDLVAISAGRDVQFEDDIADFQPAPVRDEERSLVDLAFEAGARRVVTLRFDQLV